MKISEQTKELANAVVFHVWDVTTHTGPSVLDLYRQQITSKMDEHGMLPVAKCVGCGEELNADGGHPAERYAGTFNGLCYACTNKGPIAVGTNPQGATQWNCPPHCPAWRRDRELYFQFAGCDCDHGRKWDYTSHSRYPFQCPKCMAKYQAHPVTVAANEREAAYKKAFDAWRANMAEQVIDYMNAENLFVVDTDEAKQKLVAATKAIMEKNPIPVRVREQVAA